MRIQSLAAGVLILLMTNGAHALLKDASLKADWEKFQANPKSYLQTPPKKATSGLLRARSAFTAREIKTNAFVELKAQERKSQLKAPPDRLQFFSSELGSDQTVNAFLDLKEFASRGVQPVFKLSEIDALKLHSGAIEKQPWSGSYWPIYKGGLSARYASSTFQSHSSSWSKAHDYIGASDSLAAIVARGSDDELNELSPAEKYDLLIGDPRTSEVTAAGYLAPTMWAEGQRYANETGKIETWMGYCHGWAPAALEDPRPARVIEMPLAIGRNLDFYPSDLKGLSTLLWAKGDFSHRYIGGRCDKKNPPTDPKSGRLLDPECFDVNPGIWHLVMVNQLGLLHQGLVIDATYDYEVWNQPVFSFETRYFNPQTGESSDDAESSTISIGDYSKDKFGDFRGHDSVKVVGVRMTIKYTAEKEPTHAKQDSALDDAVQTVSYLYDLEMNARGEIIGGEWYKNAHPDFLWIPAALSRPVSPGNSQIGENQAWDPSQPLPKFWKDIAVQTAVSDGMPLSQIVETLMRRSAL